MRFINFGGRFASSLSLSMSAPPNAIESTPVTELDQSNEEVADIAALAQQLKDAELRNVRIAKRKQDRAAEVKRKKDEKDEVDRLAQEAEQKAEKVNKKKQVSAVLTFRWPRLMVSWTWPRNCPRYHWYWKLRRCPRLGRVRWRRGWRLR